MTRERDIDIVEDDADERLDADELAELVESDHASGVVGFIGGLLLGAVIGAGIALLVAPERGAVTRRRLRQRVEDLREEARDQLDDLRDEAGEKLRRGRRRLRRKAVRRET